MDDICTGASSIAEALTIRDESIELLKTGGYELRKWMANDPQVLAGLSLDHQQDPHLFENPDNPNLLAVLGVQYNAVQDVLLHNFFTHQFGRSRHNNN